MKFGVFDDYCGVIAMFSAVRVQSTQNVTIQFPVEIGKRFASFLFHFHYTCSHSAKFSC